METPPESWKIEYYKINPFFYAFTYLEKYSTDFSIVFTIDLVKSRSRIV